MDRKEFNKIKAQIEEIEKMMNGGKGSGNWGHAGRPGEVGGSASEGSGKSSLETLGAKADEAAKAYYDYDEKSRLMGNRDAKKAKQLLEAMEKAREEYFKAVDESADKQDTDYKAKTRPSIHTDEKDLESKVKGYFQSKDFLDKNERLLDAVNKEEDAWDAKLGADEAEKSTKREARLYSDGPQGNLMDKEVYGAITRSGKANVSYADARKERKAIEDSIKKDVEGIIKKSGRKLKDYKVEALIGQYSNPEQRAQGDYGTFYVSIEKKRNNLDKSTYNQVKTKLETLEKLLNGGKGSGNFGHAGRPGKQGGSAPEGISVHSGSNETDYYYAEDGKRILASGKTEKEALEKAKKKLKEEKSTKKEKNVPIKGKSLYEKIHLIEPGDEVYITPKDNLPNFDRKVKVDYVEDGTIHYGSSETSDGKEYPAWAIKDITKIVRKNRAVKALEKIDIILNGGKGSGNFGHAGRKGKVGGSAPAGSVPLNYDEAKALEEKASKEFFGYVESHSGLEYDQKVVDKLGKKLEEAKDWRQSYEHDALVREYQTARYEQQRGEFEAKITSLQRTIEAYENNNKNLMETSTKMRKEGNTLAADSTDAIISENQRQIKNLKEEASKAIVKYAAESAQYHEGTGKIAFMEEDGITISLGGNSKKYATKNEVENYQGGASAAYSQRTTSKTEPRAIAGKYEVCYKGTDAGVGLPFSYDKKADAQATCDGWNQASSLIAKEVKAIKKTLNPKLYD